MSNHRRVFLGAALLSLVLLACMPFVVEKPRPLFEESISGLPTVAFPAFAALGILVLSMVEFIRAGEGAANRTGDFQGVGFTSSTLITLVLILAGAAAWTYLGYLATTALVAASMSLWLGNRNVLSILAVSAAFPAGLYWLVTRAFSTHLPAGRLLHDFFS